MLFNFFYANQDKFSLNSLQDVALPIYHGLIEGGHQVIGFGTKLQPAPAVNVLVESFPADGFVDALVKQKADNGDSLILGLICLYDVDDPVKWADEERPRRRANWLRVLPAVDFIWTLTPQIEFYDRTAGAGKTALIKYGFTERWLEREIVRSPHLRNVDVFLYGGPSLPEWRGPVVEALKQRGFTCVYGYPGGYPNYMTEDIMRRAKVSLEIANGPTAHFLSQTRIARSLHSGTLVVADGYDRSELSALYRYAETCTHDELVERCTQVIKSRTYVERGLAALARFRAETSMRDNMAQALRLPVFERLARAPG